MSWPGWLWQDQLVRQGVEPEELEEVEEVFRREEAPRGEEPWRGLAGHPALRRVRARVGNRALASLMREAARRAEATGEPGSTDARAPSRAEPDPPATDRAGEPVEPVEPGAARAPERPSWELEEPGGRPDPPARVRPRGGLRSVPGEAAESKEEEPGRHAPDRGEGRAAEEARPDGGADRRTPDPARLLRDRLRAVLASLSRGLVARAWRELLEAWPEAPPAARDTAVHALRRTILRLPAQARKKLAEALERLGPVPGVDLLPRLRSALAAFPSGAGAPASPPPDNGG